MRMRLAPQVDPADIEICSRPSGEPWLLGSGAYGQVFPGQLPVCLHGLPCHGGLSAAAALFR